MDGNDWAVWAKMMDRAFNWFIQSLLDIVDFSG